MDAKQSKLCRWASLLSEYKLNIYYKKGSELSHVDFLSRSIQDVPCPFLQERMVYFTAIESLPSLEKILSAQRGTSKPAGKGFSEKDEVIYYHGLVWVPPQLRIDIIASCHSVAPFHHPGIKKTQKTINRIFNWPGLYHDVANYLQSCLYCQRARSGRERLQGYFRTHPFPGAFETVYMDFWQCYYNNQNFLVLTIIDQLTKWAECSIIENKEANTVTKAFTNSWIYRFGVPRILMTDNDKSFINEVFDNLSSQLGITRLTSAPYHPEGNAVIETFHRNLSKGLRYINQDSMLFEDALNMILFAYRTTIHTTTNDSPAYLTYGLDLRLAPDGDWRMEPSVLDKERLQFLSKLRLDVQLKAQNASCQSNFKKNENRLPAAFSEGQLILT